MKAPYYDKPPKRPRSKPTQLSIGDLVTNEALVQPLARQLAKLEKQSEKSRAEDDFDFHLKALKFPSYARQAMFAKKATGREWLADFCFEQFKLMVEIDGLVPHHIGKGRHQTVEGMSEDMVKGNTAVLLGYAVLHFSPKMVKSGEAIETTRRVLTARGWKP
jgi:very-short-patch-repair endonuclease